MSVLLAVCLLLGSAPVITARADPIPVLPQHGDVITLRAQRNGKLVRCDPDTFSGNPDDSDYPRGMMANQNNLTEANNLYCTFRVEYAHGGKAYLRAMNGLYVTIEAPSFGSSMIRPRRAGYPEPEVDGWSTLIFEPQDDGTFKIFRNTTGTTNGGIWYIDVLEDERLQSSPNSVGDSGKFYWEYAELPLPGVSGAVKSYNPKNETTIKLMQGTAEKYRTTIEAASSGIGQQEQPFTFTGVAPGTYSLVITKEAHTSFTVQTVVVSDRNVDLTQHGHPEVRLMTLRCGDINNDGMINDSDLAILWLSANYNKSATAQGVNSRCDLNGDGMVNDTDLAILWLAANYNKGAVEVTSYDLPSNLPSL